MSAIAISHQSAWRLSFLREVIGVIPAIGVDVNQCETVIVEDTSVAVDTVGKISNRHAVHLALFAGGLRSIRHV